MVNRFILAVAVLWVVVVPYKAQAQAEVQNPVFPFWKVNGNSGTNASTNFIGTTDSVDVVIKANNQERVRIRTGGFVGIGTASPQQRLHVSGVNALVRVGGLGTGGAGITTPTAATDKLLYADANGDLRAIANGSNGQVLTINGSGVPAWATSTSTDWALTGNSGTTAGTNFIGTTDAVDWVVKTNNTERVRVLSNGNVGINTNSPITKLGVNGNASIGNTNNYVTGNNSLAVGNADTVTSANSIAAGSNNYISATNSQAFGLDNLVTGYGSFATGRHCAATGIHSVAIGYIDTAVGDGTFVGNRNNSVYGYYSAAFGTYNYAPSRGEFVIGNYATQYVPASNININSADRVFTIGNGTGTGSRADAMVVLKSGFTGIGVSTPLQRLHVGGTTAGVRIGGLATGGSFITTPTATTDKLLYADANGDLRAIANGTNGQVLTINGSGVPAWASSSSTDWSLTGNSGTTAGTNFIGTTDAVDFVIKRNNDEGLRLTAGGALWASGDVTTGITPTSGAGTRLMWIPNKGAFRAGTINGTQWDNANIGTTSAAFGNNNTASGSSTLVAGNSNTASGANSLVAGNNNTVSATHALVAGNTHNVAGNYSVVLNNSNSTTSAGTTSIAGGFQSHVSANLGLAIGWGDTTSGVSAQAFGRGNHARSFAEFTVGTFATDYTAANTGGINTADRVFTVGNGTATNARADALTVLKSGFTGVGISTPTVYLDVTGTQSGTTSLQLRSGNNSFSANSNQIVMAYDNSANYRHAIKSRHHATSQSGNAIDFYLWYQGTDAIGTVGTKQVMTLDGNHRGMVGIGTTTPKSELHITDGSSSLKAVNDGGGFGASILITDNAIPRIYFEEAGEPAEKKLMAITELNQTLSIGSLSDDGGSWDQQYILSAHRDGNVGIGIGTGLQKLHVAGTGSGVRIGGLATGGSFITTPTATTDKLLYADANGDLRAIANGSNGQVLTINGSGVPGWASGTSGWALTGNAGTTPGTNFIGTTDAQALLVKVNNSKAGYIDYSASIANTTWGYQALDSLTSGDFNTAIGYRALRVSTTGSSNTSVGYSSLINNTTGGSNIAIGVNALKNNLTGSYNIAIGNGSLNNNNTTNYNVAVGYLSMNQNKGSNNTALGNNSLYNNRGDNNVGIGNRALDTNTGGSGNTALGSGADVSDTAFTNATAIGYNTIVQQSNSLILGNNADVGIGTGAPAYTLDVRRTTAVATIHTQSTGNNAYLSVAAPSTYEASVKLNTGGLQRWLLGKSNSAESGSNAGSDFFINRYNDAGTYVDQPFFIKRSTGNVGVGSSNPTQAKLVVNGSSSNTHGPYGYLGTSGAGTFAGSNSIPVSIYANERVVASEFDAISDRRIKNVVGPTNNQADLATLMQLEITNYRFIDTLAKGSNMQKKVIAQQVEQVYPQAVSTLTDVVPDIYRLAEINNGYIAVPNNLQAGEKVKLVFADREEVTEVLKAHSGGFYVNLNQQGKVFVYGRQVTDFRTVDYEALATLNISATQQIVKTINALQVENTDMKNKLAALSSEVETIKQALQVR